MGRNPMVHSSRLQSKLKTKLRSLLKTETSPPFSPRPMVHSSQLQSKLKADPQPLLKTGTSPPFSPRTMACPLRLQLYLRAGQLCQPTSTQKHMTITTSSSHSSQGPNRPRPQTTRLWSSIAQKHLAPSTGTTTPPGPSAPLGHCQRLPSLRRLQSSPSRTNLQDHQLCPSLLLLLLLLLLPLPALARPRRHLHPPDPMGPSTPHWILWTAP